MIVWLCFILLFPALFGLDFDIAYLWRLARGQVSLLWRAEPIDRVLTRQNLDPKVRQQLELVKKIRAFAQKKIGLEVSNHYITFVDIGKGPVSWNLVVCPKDQLKPLHWSYPIVGPVPYRGFFDRKDAEEAREYYESEGYDTFLRPVSAYSTLGWFSDPILSTMLTYSEADLADLIIHELTHATVWIESDVTFNESLASFVGETGAMMWLQNRYGKGSEVIAQMLNEREDHGVFHIFLSQVATQLDSLYHTDQSNDVKIVEREHIFASAKMQFEHLPLKTNLYQNFPQWKLNNARMALYRVYQARTDIFARVYENMGENLKAFIEVIQKSEDQSNPVQWLENGLHKR